MLRQVSAFYSRKPFVVATLGGVACLLVLLGLHMLIQLTPAFRVLYIVPIWLATRFGGRWSGLILVVVTTILNTFTESALTTTGSIASLLPDTLIRFGSYGAIMLLIAQVEEGLARNHRLARHDPLTGLLNRRALVEQASDAVSHAYTTDTPLVVAVIDCDEFKLLNDRHGHETGDRVLQLLAQVLGEGTRSSDLVARYGGDEFVVVLRNTDLAEARRVMNRISKRFSQLVAQEGMGTTLSYGFARMRHSPSSLDDLLAKADSAMYRSKVEKKAAYLR